MELYAYIGVAVVVGLLIGLVTLSVIWTVRTVGKSIRDRSVSLLSAYDDLLEERSRRLSWLEEEIRRREEALPPEPEQKKTAAAPPPVPAIGSAGFLRAAERISTTAYQNTGAGELYRKIRKDFAFTPQEVLTQMSIPENVPQDGGPAARVLKELSYDTVYRLSTLPGEEQLALLRQELPRDAQDLLENYQAAHSRFDCIAFYDALRSAAASEPGPVCLRVSPKDADWLYPPQVHVVVDKDICEGMQIEMNNTLYDYCIKAREIG